MIHDPSKITYEQWQEYKNLAADALRPRMGYTLANEVIEVLTTVPCPPKPEPRKRMRA